MKTPEPTHNADSIGKRQFLTRFAMLAGGGALVQTFTACSVDPAALSQLGDIANQASRFGVPVPSEFGQAMAVVQKLSAIAEYSASQRQLAQARSKVKSANTSSASSRQYVRVTPSRESTASSTAGTHVVAYNPRTDKLDDEVIVVPEKNLSRGDSVKINGQSGSII